MNISPFKVEEWMNAYETQATINIAETCVNSVSLDELFALTGENKQAFLNAFCQPPDLRRHRRQAGTARRHLRPV